jgi:ubiquinone/menaquinone biosynthesis C-methylase UbiE
MTVLRLNNQEQSEREAYLLAHRRPTGRLGRQVAERMNAHHRPLREWGLGLGEFPEQARILDAACGGGMTARSLLREMGVSSLIGFDLSEEMARFSRRINREDVEAARCAFLAADVSDLPFRDYSFDGVVAFETTYFWPDPVRGIRELVRVLRPAGRLLIVNELYRYPGLNGEEEEIIKLLEMEVLTPEEYRDRLLAAGLEDVRISLHPDHPWIAMIARRPT